MTKIWRPYLFSLLCFLHLPPDLDAAPVNNNDRPVAKAPLLLHAASVTGVVTDALSVLFQKTLLHKPLSADELVVAHLRPSQ
jgi:hypothetical protein